MADGEEKADDGRLRWLESRVVHSFRHIKSDKLKKAFSDPDNVCVGLGNAIVSVIARPGTQQFVLTPVWFLCGAQCSYQ